MRRLSLARTLQAALLGLTVALSAIAAFGAAALTEARQDYEDRLASGLELQAAAARLLAAAVVEEATLRTAGPGTAAARRAQRAYGAALGDAAARAQDDAPSARLVAAAARNQAAVRRRRVAAGAALAARRPIADLTARQRERLEDARDDTRRRQRRAVAAIVVGGGLALLAALTLVAALLTAVRRPLDALVAASGRLAGGDLRARVDAESGPGELRELGRSFNAMADDLSRARARLEAERARLDTTIRALGDGLLLVDATGRIASANPRAVELFGAAAPGTTPEAAGVPLPPLDEALQGEVAVEHDGRTLAVTAAELGAGDAGASGETGETSDGVVWTLRDVTERARLEQLKTEFVATASHELRSPLTSIKGFVELLAADRALTDRQREFVDIVRQSTDRLVDLVNDLLDVARLEAGRLEVDLRPTDLGEVVDEVTRLLRPRLEGKGQRLEVHVGEAVPRALGDPARLRQVLTNLVTNAHLYTPERGTVTVRVDDGPAGVRLEVADTGVGMDADELEHVFDRFVRGRQQDAAGGATGSGLGLSIVKQLVDLHGGTVDVRSAPGRGTAFTVTLPRAPEPGARPGRTALAGRRVVVLDDEPEVARAIAGLLTPYGVSCEVVHDGATALALLREDPPDALTVDVLMPGMSGFEVLRALRQDPALAGVPAVVVSAFSGREALSGEWVVAKPVDPEELADALGAAVLSSRVRVLACVRAAERPRVAALLDDAGVGREWAASPQEAAELCRQHRFEVALLDAGLEDLDATVAALDLRGRRLPRAVVVLGDDDGHPGLARLDARPVPLAEAGAAVLRLLGAGGGIGSAQA